MNNDDLQSTLSQLDPIRLRLQPAYTALLHDYTVYHAGARYQGGMVALLLTVLSVSFWRRLKRAQNAEKHTWTFERKAYLGFGLLSTLVTLGMLLIVAANISNVVHPQAGFAQSIPDLGTPQVGTHKAALHQAVATWVSRAMPPCRRCWKTRCIIALPGSVPKRSSAASCSWCSLVSPAPRRRRLIHLRASEAAWSLKEKAHHHGGAGHSTPCC